jgi:hypothetical protein
MFNGASHTVTQANRVEQAARLLNWASGRRNQKANGARNPHQAQANRVEQAARLLNWASGRRNQKGRKDVRTFFGELSSDTMPSWEDQNMQTKRVGWITP